MRQETIIELLAVVKGNYDEIADEFSVTRKKYLWPELLKLTERVKDGDSILDVGCGSGRLARAFAGKQVEYVGIDNSLKLISIASQEHAGKGMHFFKGDITAVDDISILKSKKFDHIFMIAVLHHIPSQELRVKTVFRIGRLLKQGGSMVISVWNMWNQARYTGLIAKYAFGKLFGNNDYDFGDILFPWGAGKSIRYYHAFYGAELKRIAAKSGLGLERFYSDQRNYYMVLVAREPDDAI